jgi:hypothetical protein
MIGGSCETGLRPTHHFLRLDTTRWQYTTQLAAHDSSKIIRQSLRAMEAKTAALHNAAVNKDYPAYLIFLTPMVCLERVV